MKELRFTLGGGSVSESRMREFEDSLGLSLPDDYRRFMLEHNGGKPSRELFVIPAMQEEVLFDLFYQLDAEEDDLDLSSWLEEYEDDLPAGFILIGCDQGGGQLLLACEGENAPAVYYWDHEYFFDASSDEQNTYRVANSFSEFLSDLREVPTNT